MYVVCINNAAVWLMINSNDFKIVFIIFECFFGYHLFKDITSSVAERAT